MTTLNPQQTMPLPDNNDGRGPSDSTKRNTFVLLDLHGEYRDMLNYYDPEELIWMEADDLMLNPLAVPIDADGNRVTSPNRWCDRLKEWMRLVWLNDPSVDKFGRTLLKLYHDRGVIAGGDDYPSLSDLLRELEREEPRRGSDEAKAVEKLCSRLKSIIAMLPGLDVRRSRNAHDLFCKHSVILDLVTTRDTALPLLFNFLVMLFEASFTIEPAEPIRHLLIIEEAHTLLGGQTDKRTADLKETAGTGLLRFLRKTGFCGIVVNQLFDLSPAVIGNLSSIFCFRLRQRSCITKAASALGLEPWQERELARLPSREAIVRVSRHPEAVHLAVKDIENV